MRVHIAHSREETIELGKLFGMSLFPGDVVAFSGSLGSGKTTFITGACAGLGVTSHPSSPTFTFIHEYTAPFGVVAHIDLYRVGNESELEGLGIEEYFNPRTICFIEWAEIIMDRLAAPFYHITMRAGAGDDERTIAVQTVRRKYR
jgi:tRNA threonylcarbamoyladenosine biosynthesis protein TsaE